ncbi:MAG: MBL fold metallo-hydrolase [Limimaricola sp.]|uniref:MBL fold metallo-hydrolase n=1 Tax=Limimaricola sp. TaxID=2211665 RepID=UPI001DE3BC57|nr:MBL fold metallo-hydrolase [Limimaricola sp.]MBI1415793.1 MBL fold metallo-hydrolase [Limimaricola sp.]
MTLTRRQALLSGAALPLAATLSTVATPAAAASTSASLPQFRDFTLGEFRVTTLLSGSRAVPEPHKIFGLNVDDATFAEVSQQAFLPADVAQFFFTPTVVDTGAEKILFDTGPAAEGTIAALAAAGYTPDQITHVVLTHMHGDHIGGLTDANGAETFANAAYITGQTEYDAWAAMNDDGFEAKVRPLADKMTFIGDMTDVRPGITGMNAFGHTPGHMVFMLESGGKQLLLTADLANHYVYSLAHPTWEVSFDADKAMAAQSRQKMLGMLAADRVPMIGYHMPFPGAGFVEAAGEGFRFVPQSYQLML